jgi:hypothetical protein
MLFLTVRTLHIDACSIMLIMTEPGFYEDGKFGIRIESKPSLCNPAANTQGSLTTI